jgi:hypothetical protein
VSPTNGAGEERHVTPPDDNAVRRGAVPPIPRSPAPVLVVKVWHEEGEYGFRARITYTTDVFAEGEQSIVVASPGEVEKTLRAWLNNVG